ncbi:MAG: cell division protein FtsA [Candidatus Kapaibacterium sp.]|nr:cell division protein FtsA [Bacteroidota bacterium]
MIATKNQSTDRADIIDASSRPDIIVGLDIGTTKICVIVAAPDREHDTVNILGVGVAESSGLNRGVVVNIEKTVRSIELAVERAEMSSGVKIHDVYVGIAGDHIQSFQTRNIIAISNPSGEITQSDVQRLIEDSHNIAIPSDRRILHIIPQDFIIDGQDGITDPIGMSGVRMEANVHVVTGLVTAIQNIHRCIERAGLKVRELVLEPIASSHAVLDKAEKEIGVALVDIGGGTTDVAIFEDGVIRHTAMFGIAGNKVTDDVKKGLGIIQTQAESVKLTYGHAHQQSIMQDEVFMIPGINGRKPMEVSKSLLCQIIQPRMEEIFEFAFAEIKRSGYARNLSGGIVITGGCSQLRGAEELAEQVFGMPVKIGIPSGVIEGGLAPEVQAPMYATAVGLVLYALNSNANVHQEIPYQDVQTPISPSQKTNENGYKTFISRVKNFFDEL